MALPININDLLNKQKIESNRIDFKKGWNPDKIYHSICAFANDFDNIGGGYILVGVEEENGIAKRPIIGINPEELDKIQKAMVGFNNKINPYYMPRIDIEEVDGKYILVIWVPTGSYRPYNVKESVIAKQSVSKWYIRNGSSSIEAKGGVLDELRELASRVPFDDRGNSEITLDDISAIRVREELEANGSPKAIFETDEGRTYFTTTIYIHPGFENKNFLSDIRKEKDVPQNVPQNIVGNQALQKRILEMINSNNSVTREEMADHIGVSKKTIQRELKKMPSVQFIGPSKTGHWEILDN